MEERPMSITAPDSLARTRWFCIVFERNVGCDILLGS